MTDIEAAEKVLAQLQDRRDRATARVKELAAAREVLAYAFIACNDTKARDELTTLNQQLADLAVTIENIDSAVAEARRRLDAAKSDARASDAEERRVRVRALLQELEATCGQALDRTGVHPETGSIYRLNDPPARVKTAALFGSVMVELHALGIAADAKFPSHWAWDRAAWQDLRKVIIDCMREGWPGPAQRLTLKERDSFTTLLAAFGRIVRSSLEQTNNKVAA
jgi:hypothetical protein